MERLLRLAFPVVERLLMDDVGLAPKGWFAVASCAILATLAATGVFAFLIAALWLAAAPRVGSAAAALICAATLAALAATLVLTAIAFERRRRVVGTQHLREHRNELMIAALVAGLMAGGRISQNTPPPRL
jgi:hypothetical protein